MGLERACDDFCLRVGSRHAGLFTWSCEEIPELEQARTPSPGLIARDQIACVTQASSKCRKAEHGTKLCNPPGKSNLPAACTSWQSAADPAVLSPQWDCGALVVGRFADARQAGELPASTRCTASAAVPLSFLRWIRPLRCSSSPGFI
jgi:hypothetical protein